MWLVMEENFDRKDRGVALLNDRELLGGEPDVAALSQARVLLSTNVDQALIQLEALAARGSVLAMQSLAHVHKVIGGSSLNEAELWYRKAYESGSANALLNLGLLYYRSSRFRQAEEIFRDGVVRDDTPSMVWLAIVYLGYVNNIEKREAARALLEYAASRGQIRAMSHLGWLYLKGHYGWWNMPRGVSLFFRFLFEGFPLAWRDPRSQRLW